MKWNRTPTTVAVLGLLALAGACTDDGTGPELDASFDAEAALQDYAALDGVTTSDAWQGFQALGTKLSFGSVGSGGPGSVNQFLEDLGSSRSRESIADALIGNFGHWEISGEPVISPTHRGITFEWDPVTEDYVASERTGAPADGVRWIVYETDGADNPIPDQEIGFADLIDEGESSDGIALRLSVTANGLQFLDYRVEVLGGLGEGEVLIDGFIRDETHQLDFDIDVTGSRDFGEEAVDISFEAGIASRSFTISALVAGVNDATGESGSVEVAVTHGSESLAVDFSGDENEVGGTVHLNGDLFATVSGDPENPTFVGADGVGLTAAEIQVLIEVVGVADDVFTLFEDLMEPAGHVILLGIIL